MVQHSRTRYIEAKEQVKKTHGINLWFSRFASETAQVVGHPYMFLAAVFVIAFWGFSGPYFHFSDTWQLIINTGTTIITFLVVFLIQNTQNRDAKALHLKLDELIRGVEGARTHLVDLEELSDEELERLQKQFTRLRKSEPKDRRVTDELATSAE